MRFPARSTQRRVRRQPGIALIIVMISVTVLAILAGGFAYSMRVETKLARNVNSEAQLEWLGRSGVEYARWVLSEQLRITGEPYDGLDQIWAGGPGGIATTNSALMDVQNPVSLGNGSFTWKIVDLDRKFNINTAPEPILQQALTLMGADQPMLIIDSILDWIDPDDNMRSHGAENDYYQAQEPPCYCKNGPIDDLSELLLVKGIRDNPEIYWGGAFTNHFPAAFQKWPSPLGAQPALPEFNSGLVDLFTPLSSGRVNINTASADVLQLIPGINPITAQAIVSGRGGQYDGSGLTGPYRGLGDLRRIPEVTLEASRAMAQFCDVRSKVFEVRIEAQVGTYKRRFFAVLGRNSPRDIQILNFYWE